MLKKIFTYLLILACFKSTGQIHIDKKLIFNSVDTTNNAIIGVANPSQNNNAMNAGNIVNDELIYGKSVYTADTIQINLFYGPDTLVPGTWVKFKNTVANTGNTYLKINSLPAKQILSANGEALYNGELPAGQENTCIYTGSHFQQLKSFGDFCPAGFVDVNERYCIEKNEQAANYFWNATDYCQNINAKLCTWGEWYYACTQAGSLGLLNMAVNYEFVDDASDHAQNVSFVGSGPCTYHNNVSTVTYGATYKRNFRCCYSK